MMTPASPLSRLEKLAEGHEAEIFKQNPDGFHCAPYCNGDFLSSAFEAGGKAMLQILSEPGEACGPRVWVRPGFNNGEACSYQYEFQDAVEYVPLTELLQARAVLASSEARVRLLEKRIEDLLEERS